MVRQAKYEGSATCICSKQCSQGHCRNIFISSPTSLSRFPPAHPSNTLQTPSLACSDACIRMPAFRLRLHGLLRTVCRKMLVHALVVFRPSVPAATAPVVTKQSRKKQFVMEAATG